MCTRSWLVVMRFLLLSPFSNIITGHAPKKQRKKHSIKWRLWGVKLTQLQEEAAKKREGRAQGRGGGSTGAWGVSVPSLGGLSTLAS